MPYTAISDIVGSRGTFRKGDPLVPSHILPLVAILDWCRRGQAVASEEAPTPAHPTAGIETGPKVELQTRRVSRAPITKTVTPSSSPLPPSSPDTAFTPETQTSVSPPLEELD